MEKKNKLFEIADRQGGYFTARQAQSCFFSRSNFGLKTDSGEWIKEYRGIYRLAHYPVNERSELAFWSLWSADRLGKVQGVWSHETALWIHGLIDSDFDKLHLTVPKDFRRRGKIPTRLSLHYDDLSDSDTQALEGYRVTNLLRAFSDLALEGKNEDVGIAKAFQKALQIDKVRRSDILPIPILSKYLNGNSDVVYLTLKQIKLDFSYILDAFDQATRPYWVPLFINQELDGFIGGGTLVKIGNDYGILTAEHVARFFKTENLYFWSIDSFGRWKNVRFEPGFYVKEIDLAFIKIFDFEMENSYLNKKYIDLESMRLNFLRDPQKFWSSSNLCFWLHGVHTAVSEGAVVREEVVGNRVEKYLWFPKAAFDVMGIEPPRIGSFSLFGKDWEKDSIFAPIYRNGIDRHEMPRSFRGGSGSGLMMARIEINEAKSQCKILEVFLAGVLIEEQLENITSQRLVFSGPVSLYESFLSLYSADKKSKN